jgi:hypothetical protein
MMKDIPKKLLIKNNIWIEADLFYSPAFKAISRSPSNILILMRCLQKRKWETKKVGRKKVTAYTDCGFIFPYSEAVSLGLCGRTQFWQGIKKLVEVGFLDIEYQGGWYRKSETKNDYSVYRYSERWRRYGKPDFVKMEKRKVLPAHFHIRENLKRADKSNFASPKLSCSVKRSCDDILQKGQFGTAN